ncbi:flagellar hook assembly protein FlgD [Photobacterium toruni]|uniref:flagellar hook assembly protein FlgD n=1 Tax=Photobacterium toruni TaxID=1935446 RepID=UPI00210F36B9|nr:flagellar hook capping FlgD N-terminal domain-containing protein [Photobacterium toruni]
MINKTTGINPTSIKSSLASKPEKQESKGAALNDQFMALFLAQIQSQDPTEPMKNSEMLGQLAQITTVEQLELFNKNSQLSILASMSQSNMQATTLQGSDVSFKTDSVYWGSKSTELNGEIDNQGTLHGPQKITITDKAGQTVKTIDVNADENGLYKWHWDGKSNTGAMVKDGEYKITAHSIDSKTPSRVLARGIVQEIGFEPMTHAVIAGGCQFKIGDMFKTNSESK